MCGFCGYVNKEEEIKNDAIILKMNATLKFRGPNAKHVYIHDNIALGHSRLSIIDVADGTQPMQKIVNNQEYVIVYNGELYNTEELRNDLEKQGYTFSTKCDTEVALTAYIAYGDTCVNYLNGIFAFAIYDLKENNIFLARDRLGIKPLFYTMTAGDSPTFIFASEIKALLAHPNVKAILDREGIKELMGLGPAHTPGKTYFKNIFEIEAGNFANFKNFKLATTKYWDLTTKENKDTEEEAIATIHDLVVDATKRQLVSDVGICSMLSGGLDSSILAKIANDNVPNLTTFSIDYVGNDKDFVASSYQGSKDSDYVKIMKEYLHTDHKYVIVDNRELYYFLNESVIARDMPGMADIDSSMYIFCKKIQEAGFKVCLSGECSDEIFGGYPWFYKEHLIGHEGFPWALSENLRDDIVKKDLFQKGELREYVENARQSTLKNVVHLDSDDAYQRRFRDTNYLTVKWFMNTLIERTDRTSMASSLEVRVPFADHRIFEYVYNLPARMKLGFNEEGTPTEKYLLRKAFENELPNDVVYRKKSPFPKTYDPNYLALVEAQTAAMLEDSTLKIHQIIDDDYVANLLHTHGANLKENWFGQLMTYPQTLAYLNQISFWLEKYNIEIEL